MPAPKKRRHRMNPNTGDQVMIPTQIWITREMRSALAQLERNENRPMGDIVREAVEKFVKAADRRWAWEAGKIEGWTQPGPSGRGRKRHANPV